jgi:maleate cis-trans isomerase
LHWLDAANGFDAANIDNKRLDLTLSKIDLTKAEVLLIPDTALPSLDLVDHLEAMCGRPVLTANQVTLWMALDLASHPLTVAGFGRLFEVSGKED